jgi:isopentenyl-diphosphate delta-isomerase
VESFDELDIEGNPTGNVITRSDAHTNGLWHGTVHIWIPGPNKTLVWQKRSLTKDTNPGLWDISAAGHIESGQTPIDSAVREVYEETNLKINPTHLIELFRIRNSFTDPITGVVDREYQTVFWCKKQFDLTLESTNLEEVQCLDFKSYSFLKNGRDKVDHSEEYSRLYDWIVSSTKDREL